MHVALGLIPSTVQTGCGAASFSSSTQKDGAKGAVQSHPWLRSEFEASLGYMETSVLQPDRLAHQSSPNLVASGQ